MKQIQRKFFQIFAMLLFSIFLLSNLSQATYASEVKTTAEIEYRYFSMEDLTEEEKAVLHYTALPQNAEGDAIYYLAYSPIGSDLPKTGDAAVSVYGSILGLLIFIIGLTLYKKNVRIRSFLSLALAILLFSETVFMHQGWAMGYARFKEKNQTFSVSVGDALPSPRDIDGYVYRAYITFEELTSVLPDKAEAFGTNLPRATQLPVIDTKEAQEVIKTSTGSTGRVSSGGSKTISSGSGGSSNASTDNGGSGSSENKGTPSDAEMKDKIVVRIVEEEEIIDYRTLSPEYEIDESLGADERREEEGRNGSIIKEIEVTSINGVDVSSRVLRTRTIPARATKIYIGRSNPATPSVPDGGGEEVPGDSPNTGGEEVPGDNPNTGEEERTQTRRVTERTDIPFDIDYVNDPGLAYGTEETESDGITGILASVYEETYRGEEILSRVLISSDVEQRPTNKVVRRGTLLKEPPVITLTRFVKDSLANKVVLTYHLEDVDSSLVSAEALLYKHNRDEEETLVDTFALEFDGDGNKVLTIDDLVNNLDYVVKVRLQYNNRQEEITLDDLLEKEFVLGKKVEIKNITSLQLFDENNTEVDINGIATLPTNFTSYSLKINVEDGKNVILPVVAMTETQRDGAAVYQVTVDTAQLVHDTGVDFKDKAVFYLPKLVRTDGAYYTFAELVEAMRNNPTGTFVLGNNLDASSYEIPQTSNFAYVTQEFRGSLIGERDGVKYAISGLRAPLFKVTRNATIKNLDLKDVAINTTAVDIAPLASDAIGTTVIEDVAVSGSVQTERYMAGIVNKLKDNSVMRNVSFTGSLISTKDDDNAIGGAVGRSTGNATIERTNIHADITVKTTRTIGNIGGIVGNMRDTSKLYRSYVEGSIYNSGNTTGSVGGAVGLATQNPIADDVVAAVEVTNGYKTYGGNAASVTRFTNIHYVDGKSQGEEDRQAPASIAISESQAEQKVEGYQLTATLEDSNFNHNIGRTNYNEAVGYDASKERIYRNMEKLVPFYDKQTIVDLGNTQDAAARFADKDIVSVTPMQDNTIFYDLANNRENLNKIVIVYADQTSEVLPVRYKATFADTKIEEYAVGDTALLYTPEIFRHTYGAEVDALVEAMAALNYKDVLFRLYPDFEYSFAQKVGYTYALDLQYNVQANHQTAAEKLKEQRVDPYSLEKSFNAVKTDLRKYIIALLESGDVDDTTKFNPEQKLAYMMANKEKMMLGLSYINRWYNFKVGEVDAREITIYKQDIFGKKSDMVQNIIDMADIANPMTDNSRKFLLFGEHSATAYAKIFGARNGRAGIVEYLEGLVSIFNPNQAIQDWFVEATKAEIVEKPMEFEGTQLGVYRLWDNLKKGSNAKLMLPILALPSKSVGIVSHPSAVAFLPFENYYNVAEGQTYDEMPEVIANMRTRLEGAAEVMRLNFEFWYRVSYAEVRDRLWNHSKVPMLTWDGYRHNSGKWVNPFSIEEAPNPSTKNLSAGPGTAEFFTPIGKWYANNGLGAYADGSIIHFVFNTLLTKLGGGIFTHEAVHNLDGTVYLGGYGRRMGAEDYATGMWHSVADIKDEAFGMNVDIDYNVYGNGADLTKRLHNASPERFANAQDLKEYWSGSMDVLYTLFYAEAQELLALSREDLAYMIEKTEWRTNASGQYEEILRNVTVEELEAMNLQGIDDLVDNQLLVYPFGKKTNASNTRTVPQNSYETFNRFNAFFGTYTAEGAKTGSRAFKGMAFEMLGAAGYDGFVNYTSNKLEAQARAEGATFSDSYILNQTFGGRYQTMSAFRKAMFAERYAKKDLIKPFVYKNVTYTTYEDMRTLLRAAIQRDLAKAKTFDFSYTNTRELKRDIFKYYLQSTNDFRESIYR